MATPLLSDAFRIDSVTSPNARAVGLAAAVMERAFDPRYGEAWTSSQLDSFLSLPGVTLSLARIDEACLGFSLTRQVLDEAELLLIATDPGWRGRGVGSRLLEQLFAEARWGRISTVHLEVRDNNPAIDFYFRHGFEQVHRRPSYYKGTDGTCYDALTLHRLLP